MQSILKRNLDQAKAEAPVEAFLAQDQDPGCRELSFEERFGLLVDREWTYREDRRLQRLLKEAHLKTQACAEDIDYAHSRGLERSIMAGLSSYLWVRDHQNILVTGPTGVGKTFICCALANLACRNGFSSRYYRLPRLFTDLGIARGDGSYPSLLRKLAKTDLLVLDDWGLGPLTTSESRELLEVLEDRCQTRSTVMASQAPVDKWYKLLPNPTVADAVMDRLVHNAYKIALRGESMRRSSPRTVRKGVSLEAEPTSVLLMWYRRRQTWKSGRLIPEPVDGSKRIKWSIRPDYAHKTFQAFNIHLVGAPETLQHPHS